MKKTKKTQHKKGNGGSKATGVAGFPPMRTWFDPITNLPADPDRRGGLADFEAGMAAHPSEITPCKTIKGHARTKFAEWGRFYIEGEPPAAGFAPYDPNGDRRPIPKDTVFRVFEKFDVDRPERDKQVILIVPDPSSDDEPVHQIWRCTYSPYTLGATLRPPHRKKR